MLRSGAWLLQRSWRHPQRLPAGWRSERFARKVDHTRQQLRPIRSLAALSDSFARESRYVAAGPTSAAGPCQVLYEGTPLEVAYVMRWIELYAGRELRGWRTICQRALP
jgi:hypothetical protein